MGAKEPPREETYVSRDEEIRPDVFEVSGSIKWFDPAKGYGFILPDEDLPDVLLHVSCLRRDGFQTAYEGSRIICDVVKTPKGLQAARIRGMDDSTAIRPAQLPQRTHVVVTAESDWEKAVVKWFNRLRGFGFLSVVLKRPTYSSIWRHSAAVASPNFSLARPCLCDMEGEQTV
jgi:CspA family cold shock protein